MFQKKTVIVVGAGASKEVRLPIGKELAAEIGRMLDFGPHGDADWSVLLASVGGDSHLRDALRILGQRAEDTEAELAELAAAALRISRAMPQAASIDSFIDAHRGESGNRDVWEAGHREGHPVS